MKESPVKVTFAGNPLTLLGNEIKVGDKAPDFIAVGAGHLGGNEGIIKLLRHKGYSLTPVR